jgi:SAM-dependent methyltransferase
MYDILLLILFILLLSYLYGSWKGAPWFPTRKKDVERFLRLAEIKKGQKVYDLGCGDGRMVCVAAGEGAEAYGFEVSLFPFFLAHIRRFFHPNKNTIHITLQDIWNISFSDADVLYFFLMPKVYNKITEKFEKELKKGTRVIVYVWPIEGWEPVKVDSLVGYPNIYVYQI